jgi:hypothetical protein
MVEPFGREFKAAIIWNEKTKGFVETKREKSVEEKVKKAAGKEISILVHRTMRLITHQLNM